MPTNTTTFEGVFDTILAGRPSSEIAAALEALQADDRQALLCTVCAIRDEIERNSSEHARDIQLLLQAQCPLFIDGVATCLIDNWNCEK